MLNYAFLHMINHIAAVENYVDMQHKRVNM